MPLDRLDLLEARLGSGKVYLVPRALWEGIVRVYLVESLALIQEAGVERILSIPREGRGTSTTWENGRFLSEMNRKGTSP